MKSVVDVDGDGKRDTAWYAFDLGDRIGTGSGIGCVQTAAGQRLVGLDEAITPNGKVVDWSRTIIVLNGLHAHNGARTSGVYNLPADQARVNLLTDITCGDLTIHGNGVSLPG